MGGSLLADVYVNRLALPFLVPKLPTVGHLISKELNLSSPCTWALTAELPVPNPHCFLILLPAPSFFINLLFSNN